MTKHKTRKSLTKRFKITKTGKILRKQAFRRHLSAKKTKKKLTNLKKSLQVKGFYAKKLRRVMNIKKTKNKKTENKTDKPIKMIKKGKNAKS